MCIFLGEYYSIFFIISESVIPFLPNKTGSIQILNNQGEQTSRSSSKNNNSSRYPLRELTQIFARDVNSELKRL